MKELTKLGISTLTKFGISTYLNSEYLFAIKKTKIKHLEIGVEELEVEGKMDIAKIDNIESFLKESSMNLNSVHAPFGINPSNRTHLMDISSIDEEERADSLEEVKKGLDLLIRLGGEILVVHPSPPAHLRPIADDIRPAKLEQCKRSLKEIIEVCKRKKIKLAVENTTKTSLGNSSVEILEILEGLDPETIGVCLDTNHMNLKEDLVEAVYRIGERLFTLHVSDNDGREEKHWFPFEGVIEWKPFIEALVNCQYDGVFMYEVITNSMKNLGEVLQKVEKNFEKMKKMID